MSAAPVSIRPLQPEDYADWQDLWARYNAFYGREGDTALDSEIVTTTWKRLMSDEEPVYGLVADLGRALVGLTHFVFHRNLIHIADTCYMQDLFTAEAARGHGVGRKLIDGVADACRARGVGDIYWHTQASNKTARALYDRLARNTDFLVYRTDVG
ncbi:GNAT family N-acetyltransferase [Nisaea sp.]|uniref:GNAT family N-acetyltransferase n=1 Tax=Nisaea sp. TaxID=2024842 RepID=UPI003263EBE9